MHWVRWVVVLAVLWGTTTFLVHAKSTTPAAGTLTTNAPRSFSSQIRSSRKSRRRRRNSRSSIVRGGGGTSRGAAAEDETALERGDESPKATTPDHNNSHNITTVTNESTLMEEKEEHLLQLNVFTDPNSTEKNAASPHSILEDNVVDNNNTSVEITASTAAQCRARGKELHDAGEYAAAAAQFAMAAQLLSSHNNNDDDEDEFATCRLHQALCCLKSGQYDTVVQVCTELLEDDQASHPVQVRARAAFRRAKAYVQLQEPDLALADARRAAFWGDRKAVTFYGQLLREHATTTTSSSSPKNRNRPSSQSPTTSSSSWKNGETDPESDPLSATTTTTAAMPFGNNNAALLESLLSKSSSTDSSGFSPASFLLQGLGGVGNKNKNSNDGSSLAQSVLHKLSQKLDDTATQEQICQYLQQYGHAPMLQSMAGMAGMALPTAQAESLARLAQSVTPQRLQKGVRYTKRTVAVWQFVRQVWRVIQKYRPHLLICGLLWWTHSALVRPLPVPRRRRPPAVAPPSRGPAGPPNNNNSKNSNNNNKRGSGPVGMPVLLQQRRL